jgi:hypothetical protein
MIASQRRRMVGASAGIGCRRLTPRRTGRLRVRKRRRLTWIVEMPAHRSELACRFGAGAVAPQAGSASQSFGQLGVGA